MKPRELLLSPLAEADMVDIGEYISINNPKRARTLIVELRTFLQKVAERPLMGRPRNELRRGLRSMPFVGYSYTIYYRVLPRRRGITVERILHHARDTSRLF